ncbi:MAG: sugar transferase [Aridibacter famidurans]|nr:sugar transferase [Aridibacter famidurans]
MDKKISADEETPVLAPFEQKAPSWVMPSVRILIAGTDMVLAFLSLSIAFGLREGSRWIDTGSLAFSREFLPYASIALLAMPLRAGACWYHSLYSLSGAFSYISEFLKVQKATLTGSLLLIAATFLFRGGFEFRDFSYSRGVFLIDFAIAAGAYSVFHLGLRMFQSFFRRRGLNLKPTLIVGTNKEAERTVEELLKRPELGFRIAGVISTQKGGEVHVIDSGADRSFHRARVIGGLEDLPQLIRELRIEEVIITDDKIPEEFLFETMLTGGRHGKVEFRFAPSLFNSIPQKTNVDQIGVLPVVTLFREPFSESGRLVKRVLDIVVAMISIIALAPLWLLSAIMIKLDSPGPILFRQERVGMDGRIFECLKFRTMRTGSDDSIHRESYQKHIKGGAGDAAGKRGKVADDPRITRVGAWLRRWSIDEIPQLFNVLKGDMSVVGPRPPIHYEVREYDVWHRKRLDIKPGITGLWQVSGRNNLMFEEMVRLDLYYIENWSVWLDLRIMLMTLPAVFRGEGEER